MSTQTEAIATDVKQLAEDARALMAATAKMAGEHVEAVRKRLSAALDGGREMCGQAKDKAVEGARVANTALHQHPYRAIAAAVGAGLVIGYLTARRRCH